MKAVILAGGFGTRISEESHLKPKPMLEIGDKPILWHIMKMYSKCGINDFVICAGYKQHVIKEWFSNYALYTADERALENVPIYCGTKDKTTLYTEKFSCVIPAMPPVMSGSRRVPAKRVSTVSVRLSDGGSVSSMAYILSRFPVARYTISAQSRSSIA